MKRSKSIRLVLIGSLSAGALGGCGPSGNQPAPAVVSSVYTNNHYVPGVGYYHAPFRAWYALPYNQYDPRTQRYYQGGQWLALPHQSITNISPPTAEAERMADARRTDVQRHGFGGTSHHYFTHS